MARGDADELRGGCSGMEACMRVRPARGVDPLGAAGRGPDVDDEVLPLKRAAWDGERALERHEDPRAVSGDRTATAATATRNALVVVVSAPAHAHNDHTSPRHERFGDVSSVVLSCARDTG